MAGRIRSEDVVTVREHSAIAEVVAEYVTLVRAGGGSLKGLCPFHEERTPSLHVTPARGLWYCFGCGEGGDVVDFVSRIDHLSFAETVEHLASRAKITLRYEEGGAAPGRQQGLRTRLVQAHRVAAEFYREFLGSPAAAVGRRFLAERGFDEAAAAPFGVGYAPGGWDALVRHLRSHGYSDEEMVTGGLARRGQRGLIDPFRDRLVWPIRDRSGDVVGFGARRLREDDTSPKYLNTPDTPLYKKSEVLYGIDLARRDIAARRQAVVVEGYTDVMAAHLAGVTTAVATCGTAFGSGHIRLLRQLLMDSDELRGEVIFTFDGDEAGRKAALRAFADDQRFVMSTYVAVSPDGMDPCELRQRRGDAAVRELVAHRSPLFEFAIRSALAGYDLDTAEGRVQAVRAGIPVVAAIRDVALRDDYARRLAGWVGLLDPGEVLASVRAAARRPRVASTRPRPGRSADQQPGSSPARAGDLVPDRPSGPVAQVEREVLKVALQQPASLASTGAYDQVVAEHFTVAAYADTWSGVVGAVGSAGWSVDGGAAWVGAVRERAVDDRVRAVVAELAVEDLHADPEADPAHYAAVLVWRLQEIAAARRIGELKSRLQRLDPVGEAQEYAGVFTELLHAEEQRRSLGERAARGA